jgi:para-nitrobenzyl esterase
VAPQGVGATDALIGGKEPDWNEDCLFLNVQTPALDDGRRPVMVWIHGGGFTSGAGSIPWYNGARFVTNGDVVVVTINYRLGAFGWLYLGHRDQTLIASGNAGLSDQIAALRWVRDNIAAFGGDPGNVTIFGESAGAMSVATLMGTPAAAGLFHKAIAQSGAAHHTQLPDMAADMTDRIMDALAVTSVAELVDVPAGALLDAQLSVSTDVAKERVASAENTGLGLPFSPVVDGAMLPSAPLDAIANGASASVPLLTGTNLDEWNLFGLAARAPADADAIARRLGRIVEDPHEVAATYRRSRDGADHGELWSAIMTDRVFRIPAIRLAEAQARHRRSNTFMYEFDWASSAFGGRLGSCHALEIPFAFDNLHQPGVAFFTGAHPPQALATAMHRAWIAFARNGRPDHDGLPPWPAYDSQRRATMHFNVSCAVGDDPAADRRAAWNGAL